LHVLVGVALGMEWRGGSGLNIGGEICCGGAGESKRAKGLSRWTGGSLRAACKH